MKTRRFIGLFLLAAALLPGAETRMTVAQCQSLLADQTANAVSPRDLRDCLIASALLATTNAQTGTTYTVVTLDRGKSVTHSNGSAIAVTLPQAGTTGFEAGFWYYVKNLGAGTATITPTTSTIAGGATLALTTGQWGIVFSDGTNYNFYGLRITAGTGLTVTDAVSGQTIAVTDQVYNVKDSTYGAAGDGATDDRVAIQAALDAANGAGVVFFPPGTYMISPIGDDSLFLDVPTGTKIQGAGMALTTIKVIDSAGVYYSIFKSDTDSDCSDCEFRDFTVDSNIANNSVADTAEIDANPRIEFLFYTGDPATFDHVRITETSAKQHFVVNGSTVNHVSITNCRVDNSGDDPNNVVHDTSAVYLGGDNFVIANNFFQADSRDAPGGKTAIETHGTNGVISGNVILDFMFGMNITGIDLVDDKSLSIFGNSIEGALYGIYLWSQQYSTHTTGYGLDGVSIVGNSITINQVDYADAKTGGITVEAGTSLPLRNIVIANNTIKFDLEGIDRDGSTSSMGIGYWNSAGSDQIENLIVTGNVIENAPVQGIRFTCPITNAIIANNVIRNAGSSLDEDVAASYKIPIFMSFQPGHGVEIRNNLIVDDIATSLMTYGMTFFPQANTEGVEITGNTIRLTGGTSQASFVRPYDFNDDTDTVYLLRARIDGFAAPAGGVEFAAGSHVYDPTNGVEWRVLELDGPFFRPLPGNVATTGLTAAVGATNLVATAQAGLYHVSGYMQTTTAADGACSSDVDIGWTYNSDAKALEVVTDHDQNADEEYSQIPPTIVRSDAAANITYAISLDIDADCTNATFDAYLLAERLQ